VNDVFAPGSIWAGETAVVVAGGPSVSLRQVRAIGMARSNDRCRVVAVSDAVYPCWFSDILFSSDAKWWDHHGGVPGFKGQRVSRNCLGRYGVDYLRETGAEGFDPEPGTVRHGSNSGHQAVHLAAQLGAARIVIVGIEFTDKDFARDHWFGRHPGRMDMCSDTAAWRKHFRVLTDALQARQVSVLNASPASTVNWLPHFDLETLLA
jgi:hypothetical protein